MSAPQQRRSARISDKFPLFLLARVTGNRGILRRKIDGWLIISGNNSEISQRRLRHPRPLQLGKGEDKPSSISDTRRDASGDHSPTRNGASKDGDDATTRHAVHSSNAKSIRSTSTALLPVERRQRYRSPRRRVSPGRISSSLYLLVAYHLNAQREDKPNYSY